MQESQLMYKVYNIRSLEFAHLCSAGYKLLFGLPNF